MWVLGINVGHQSGATLVKDGKVFVSINLERITRIKNDNGYPSPEENNWDYSLIEFPWKAMDYCLDYANIQKMDLDRIVWNGIGLTPAQQISVDGFLAQKLKKNGYNLSDDKLNYCTHHLAHAYSAHYSSGFDESIILVADNAGEMNYKETVDDFVENKIAHIQRTRLGECVEATSIYEVKKGVFSRVYSRYKPAYSYFNTVGKHTDGSGFSTRYRVGKSLGEFYYDNILINTNVLEACRMTDVKKVVSFLLYMNGGELTEVNSTDSFPCWKDDWVGGTDLWEVTDEIIPYDKNEDSVDYQMREGRYSDKPHSLKEDEAERIKKFLSIDFKPNRLVGFVRTDTSYHSIPPRMLDEGQSRDCVQINIWYSDE